MAARVSIEVNRPDRAAELLAPVLQTYPQENSRESALYWAALAEGYAKAGELDGAREALDTAREFAERVNSLRADQRVSHVEALITS